MKQWIASVCLSVRLFPLHLLNQLTFELAFVCVWGGGHDHSSPRIKNQGHRSRSKVNVQSIWAWQRSNAAGLTFILDSMTVFSYGPKLTRWRPCEVTTEQFSAILTPLEYVVNHSVEINTVDAPSDRNVTISLYALLRAFGSFIFRSPLGPQFQKPRHCRGCTPQLQILTSKCVVHRIYYGIQDIGVGTYLLGAARAVPLYKVWDGLHANFAVRAVPLFSKF